MIPSMVSKHCIDGSNVKDGMMMLKLKMPYHLQRLPRKNFWNFYPYSKNFGPILTLF